MKKSIDETITTCNIKAGDVVRNYPAMCSLLNEKVINGGESKRYQLKDWKRFFSHERDGNKYKILEVYSTPKVKERKLSGATIIRNWTVLNSLVDGLNKGEEFRESYRTTRELFILLGVCNENFYNSRRFSQLKLKNNPTNLAIYNDSIFFGIPLNDTRSFYDLVVTRGKRLVDSLVTTFPKQCGVEIKKTYSINYDGSSSRYATDNEHIEIEEAIERTLQLPTYLKEVDGSLEASTMQDIFLKRKFNQFYEDVANDSKLEALGISEFYVVYRFRLTSEIVTKLAEYGRLVGKIDNYAIVLNKRSYLYHQAKMTKEINKDYHEWTSLIMGSNPITFEELNQHIKTSDFPGIRQDGSRGQKGYSTGRKLLINELVKQV